MHKNFSDWYREADIEPTAKILEDRYAAIENYSGSINEIKCLNLVKLLMGFPVVEDFVDDFINYFVEVDTAFPRRNNRFELTILSGATLVNVIEKYSKYDFIAALSIVTGSFTVSKDTPPIQDIIIAAENFLNVSSANLRTELSSLDPPPKLSITKSTRKKARPFLKHF